MRSPEMIRLIMMIMTRYDAMCVNHICVMSDWAGPPECRQPLQLFATPPRTRPHNSLKTRRLFNSETPAPALLINFLFISLVLTNYIRMVLILPCVVWPQIKLSFSQIIDWSQTDKWAFNLSWHQVYPALVFYIRSVHFSLLEKMDKNWISLEFWMFLSLSAKAFIKVQLP